MSFRIWVYFAMNKKLTLFLCSLVILRSVFPVPPMRSAVNLSGKLPLISDLRVGQISGDRLPMPPTQKNDNPSPRKVNFNESEDPTPEIETIHLPAHKKSGRVPIYGSDLRKPAIGSISPNNFWSQAHRTEEELNTFQPGYKPIGYTDVEPISKREARTFYTDPKFDAAKADFDNAQNTRAAARALRKKQRQEEQNRQVEIAALQAEHNAATVDLVNQRNVEMREILKQMADEQAEIDRKNFQKFRIDQNAQRTQIENEQENTRRKMLEDFQAGLPKAPEKTPEEIKFEQMQAFVTQSKRPSQRDSMFTESQNLDIDQSLSKPARLAPLRSEVNPIPPLGRKLAPMNNLSPAFDLDAVARLKAAEKAMYQQEARESAAKAEQEAQSQMN